MQSEGISMHNPKLSLRLQEHLIHERASFLKDLPQTQPVPHPSSESTNGSKTKQQAELSADYITALLQELAAIPYYVRKLERKKLAAEKSNNSKAKRISELEVEIQKCVTLSLSAVA
jgi:hypothetical protein